MIIYISRRIKTLLSGQWYRWPGSSHTWVSFLLPDVFQLFKLFQEQWVLPLPVNDKATDSTNGFKITVMLVRPILIRFLGRSSMWVHLKASAHLYKILRRGYTWRLFWCRLLNTAAFLPIARSRFKQRLASLLILLTTAWRFCVNFWVIFGHFGKEIFFLKA